MRSSRGFTLVEVMVVVAVVAILAGLGTWQMQRQLPRYRANAAAGKLVLDIRKAISIAARTNRPVTLTVNPSGCAPGYVLATSDAVYERVCLEADYKGVEFRGGIAENISCAQESGLSYPPITACSLCTDGASIRFLPNGEVLTNSGQDESVVFGPKNDSRAFDAAVGIRNGTGKARTYKRVGGGWDCP